MAAGRSILSLLTWLILFSCQNQENSEPLTSHQRPDHQFVNKHIFHDVDSLFQKGDYEKAGQFYLDISEDLIDKHEERSLLYAISRASISHVYLKQEEKAIGILRTAAPYIDKIDPKDTLLADYYYSFGIAFNYLSEGDSSKKYHQKALAIREQIFSKPDIALAESYIGLGNAESYLLNDYLSGQEYYENALSVLTQLNDTANNETLLRCYYNLANIHKTLRNLDKGKYYANGALELAQRLKSTVYVKYCHNMLAGIFNLKLDYQNAIIHYQQVLVILNEEDPTDYVFLASTYYNLGLNHSNNLNYEKSIYWTNRALTLYKDGLLAKNRLYADILILYGKSRFYLTNDISEISLIKEGIHMLEENTGISLNLANAYAVLADCYTSINENNHAIDYFLKSLSILLVEKDNEKGEKTLAYINNPKAYLFLSKLANVHFEQYQMDNNLSDIKSALFYYQESDSLLQLIKNTNLIDSDEIAYNSQFQVNFNRAFECIEILNHEGYNDGLKKSSLQLMEHNKSRILYKAVKGAELQKSLGVPDSIIQALKSRRQEINYLQSEPNNEQVKGKLLTLTNELDYLNNYLKNNYPSYFKYTVSNDSTTLKNLQKYSRENNAAILNYFYGVNTITVLSVQPDTTILFFVNNDSLFQHELNQYSQLLIHPNYISNEQFQEFTQASHFLYDKLIKKGLSSNEQINKLIIIPDKGLAAFPFESFTTGNFENEGVDYKNLDYLIKRYEISYHHSSSFLLDSERSPSTPKDDLAFGGWAYMTLNYDSLDMPPLQHSLDEIRAVSSGFNTTLFVNSDATETSFKNHSSAFDILHLSIHGSASYDGQPCLFLNADTANDGFLYAHELYKIKNQSDLVVLSSCESGIGEQAPGEGLMNIARGFFYSGCPSVLITLSKVVDQSSSKLQNSFYAHLKEGMSKSSSLQEAKVKYIDESDNFTAHPANWAPPVLWGATEPVMVNNEVSTTKKIAIILVIIIATFFLLKNFSIGTRK